MVNIFTLALNVPFHRDLRISSVVHKGVAYITSVQRCSVVSKGSGYEIIYIIRILKLKRKSSSINNFHNLFLFFLIGGESH